MACIVALVPAPARAQIGSVSMTTAPSPSVSWSLASAGANTTSGGAMTLDATAPYTVTVVADRATMGEHDGSGYVSGGKSLTSPLSVITARTGGTALIPGVGATVVTGTSPGVLVTGTGPGTDTFSITLSQPTALTDAALVPGRTYHIVLTYTASLVL